MELAAKIDRTRGLGIEFLTWLLYQSVTNDGVVEGKTKKMEVWFDDTMRLRSMLDTEVQVSFRGGSPFDSTEMFEALRSGKMLEQAKMSVMYDGKTWDLDFNGPKFEMGGIKLPDLLSETLFEKVMERFYLLTSLEELVFDLYGKYLDIRLQPDQFNKYLLDARHWIETHE